MTRALHYLSILIGGLLLMAVSYAAVAGIVWALWRLSHAIVSWGM